MITFSFDKIVEFLKTKGWERKKDTKFHYCFLPPADLGIDIEYFLYLPKENIENPTKHFDNDIQNVIVTLSNIYKIPFHELALIHFAETSTVLTLAEYVSEFSHGVGEYAKFLGQTFDESKIVDLFENLKEQYGSFYTPNDYVVITFRHDYYDFLYDGDEIELPLPKTVENFVTDFLRIVGEQKRLKFKQI